jgi:hypothetical protein
MRLLLGKLCPIRNASCSCHLEDEECSGGGVRKSSRERCSFLCGRWTAKDLRLKYLSVDGLNYVWTKVAVMGGTVKLGNCEPYEEKRIGDAARYKTEGL